MIPSVSHHQAGGGFVQDSLRYCYAGCGFDPCRNSESRARQCQGGGRGYGTQVDVIVRSIKVQRSLDLARGSLRTRHVGQSACVAITAGVGRGGARSFVEGVVRNQPRVGLRNKKTSTQPTGGSVAKAQQYITGSHSHRVLLGYSGSSSTL